VIRSLKIVLVGLSVALLTTGCVKFNLDLEVKQDDTVSGTMVFAVAKGLSDLGDQSETGSTSPETEGLLGQAENVKVEPFDDGDFVGSSYTFENVPLEEFTPEIGDGGTFGLSRDGDNIVVSGLLDSSTPTEDQQDNPFGGAFLEGIFNSSDIRISVTLPGEIKETNGTVEGQTITWEGKFGEKLELSAIAYAPKIDPLVWIVGSSLVIGLVVGLLTLLILRMRRRAQAKEPRTIRSSNSVPTKAAVSAKVGLSDSDIKVLETEYSTNPERFAMDYLSQTEFKKWREAGEPSLKPWIGMGMVNFKKWLDLHK
jgi:hypothetical protein